MTKGIDRAVTSLIFIIIVVVIGAVLLFTYAPYLQNVIAQYFPGQTQQSVDFDNVLKCAYYRCVDGCNSDKVKSMTATWSDPQTHTDVSCADFCKSGGTICNTDSSSNPVRIDIGEKAYLAQDKLKSEFGTDCIISPDFQQGGSDLANQIWTLVQNGIVASSPLTYIFAQLTGQQINVVSFVYINSTSSIDTSSIQYQHVDCYVKTFKWGSNALSSLLLEPGKYQVSMSHFDNGIVRWEEIYISPYQKSATATSATLVTSCTAQGGVCKPACDTSSGEQNIGQLDCQRTVLAGTAVGTCCKK